MILLSALLATSVFAADKKESEYGKRLDKVIELRKEALKEYGECMDSAKDTKEAEACAETLREQGNELNDMRDGTGNYATTSSENTNIYIPTDDEVKKDKKLSECFDKTEGNKECFYNFTTLNLKDFIKYVDGIPAKGKK